MIASLRQHSDAVLAALVSTGVPVGDADPDIGEVGWQATPGQSEFLAYMVLYPLAGGTFDGPTAEPDDDAELYFQVTCVGANRAQCEWVLDQALGVLVGDQDVTVPDRSTLRIEADMAGGGVRRDDTVQPPVFISTPRFRLWTTPA
jgi:hypothetical protein